MDIEIDSKRNNPLLNRTEIYFTVKHEGEGTPNREIIRSELAEKLNVKKENIVVNTLHSSFGDQEITGYAKVYSSLAKLKDLERDYILRRNKLVEPKEKKKVEEKPAETPKEEGAEEKPVEPSGEVKEETPVEEQLKDDEQPVEEPLKEEEKPPEETPVKEPSEVESSEPSKEEKEKEAPKTEEKPVEEATEKPAEEPKKEPAEKSEQPTEEKEE